MDVVLVYIYQINMTLNAVKISKIKISKVSESKSLVWTIYCVPENSKHLHENFAKFFDDMWSLAVRSFKESNLLGGMNVNYLVKDNRTEIKSVISSHGIEELIK